MSLSLGRDITSQLRLWKIPEFPVKNVICQEAIKGGRRTLIHKGIITLSTDVPRQVIIKTVNMTYITMSKDPNLYSQRLVEYFKRECQIWRDLGTHQNIAPLLGFITSSGTEVLPSLLMHYYSMGDLRSFVTGHGKNLSMKERAHLMLGVARGLAHMHEREPAVIHRDLKGDNILVEILGSGRLNTRITDFGSAKLSDVFSEIPGGTSRFATLNWCPPEYITEVDGKLHLRVTHASREVDVWMYACTFLEILKGEDPWPTFRQIDKQLFKGSHPPRPEFPLIDNCIWDLLENCWYPEPGSRLNAPQIVSRLEGGLLRNGSRTGDVSVI